eukprot:TRINITY_DN9095_c0_g1_i1.p1 TRINITY_DN9095_c0_g1~~TRINITY_DN9095_c0_g1_i1.p1  ORF type:complete len:404 (-),score=73.80 TRINITY_DN9095_c0_g1_i1:177-1340(-)
MTSSTPTVKVVAKKICPNFESPCKDSLNGKECKCKGDDVTLLNKAFESFRDEFLGSLEKDLEMPSFAVNRTKKLVDYTAIGGKCYRGSLVLQTVRLLCEANPEKLQFDKMKKQMLALAVAIELLQASYLVADDIMDYSLTRRNKPCWYKIPEVGLDAVNDSFVLESFVYFLLGRYFDGTAYQQMSRLFHDVAWRTISGQSLDTQLQPQGPEGKKKAAEQLKLFSLDLYKKIVRLKTAYYTMYLPIAAGLILCGMSSEKELQIAQKISVDIGEKFQIQDDYLDCYGDPKVIGKVGTDIKDHKCSWLLVQALLKCSPEQLKIIQENYGKDDEKCEKKVKELYSAIGMKDIYMQQETSSYKNIKAVCLEQKLLPPEIFLSILDKIQLRIK